jgi:hypothetical protein
MHSKVPPPLEILKDTRFITVSTICADGSPWATPIGWFAFDGRNIVFDNRQGTIHADNLARDNRCFITVVNHDEPRARAIYVTSRANKLAGNEYEHAKELIMARGKNVTDDIFAVPIGETISDKSEINEKRFYCYMRYND